LVLGTALAEVSLARSGLAEGKSSNPQSPVFIGSTDHVVDEMRARRDRYGISYYVVLDHAMEEAGLIVARLAGT
jgi:hypothetical protein